MPKLQGKKPRPDRDHRRDLRIVKLAPVGIFAKGLQLFPGKIRQKGRHHGLSHPAIGHSRHHHDLLPGKLRQPGGEKQASVGSQPL